MKFTVIQMEENGAPSLNAGELHKVKTEMKVLSKDRVVFVTIFPSVCQRKR